MDFQEIHNKEDKDRHHMEKEMNNNPTMEEKMNNHFSHPQVQNV